MIFEDVENYFKLSKKPGTSFQMEIHFAVFNRFYFIFSFMKLVET